MFDDFTSRINFELKRAERYRFFISLVVLNLGPVLEAMESPDHTNGHNRERFLTDIGGLIRKSVREIDAVSNSGRSKIALLFPETSRQGAEAAAHRISEVLTSFCASYFKRPADYLIPVEISSFPDAAGARSVASYLEEFSQKN
jgi:PleD family two-component response regulator